MRKLLAGGASALALAMVCGAQAATCNTSCGPGFYEVDLGAGTWNFSLGGGAGGAGNSVSGASGNAITGQFTLTTPTVLDVMVGAKGASSTEGGGGGGGSFLIYQSSPTVVAIVGGGGGGAGFFTGAPISLARGGDGGSLSYTSTKLHSGSAFSVGGLGGTGAYGAGDGGYGGGGGGAIGGGGGGGYSGGAGGGVASTYSGRTGFTSPPVDVPGHTNPYNGQFYAGYTIPGTYFPPIAAYTRGSGGASGSDLVGGLVGGYALSDASNAGQGFASFSLVGGAAPEPSSWALMIGGVALVGAILRRRRVRGATRLGLLGYKLQRRLDT
ncbi:MAG TPA: PEPxxWA-CTERM sorting domain-containing protein [Caulobacteraceae bacterium]|jgi:hypothetical protein|nr:PEPxxWA-CTERM sorting domain-containing protein [Caulobacteraceae bacterium]